MSNSVVSVNDMEYLDKIMKNLRNKKSFAIDLGYEEEKCKRFRIKYIAFSSSHQKKQSYFVNIDKFEMDRRKVISKMGRLLAQSSLIIGYDLKNLYNAFKSYNIVIDGNLFDVKIAAYLLNPDSKLGNLKFICQKYKLNPEIPVTSLLFLLYEKMLGELNKNGIYHLFKEVEMPLIKVLSSMEIKGICLDLNYMKKFLKRLDKKIYNIKNSIFEIADEEFNLDSPKQVASILFNKFKLPIIKRGKTGPSTDVEVLLKLSALHSLPNSLLEYRELKKIKSAYVSKLLKMATENSGRLHTGFDQCTTATGRLASSNPNLQNIPIRSSWGKNLRKAFISEPESLLVSADYSQIELRILAHFSEDKRLLEWFRRGKDVHIHTASLIFNVPEDKVDKQMRDTAKTVNFGIIYGISPYGLTRQLDISTQQARDFIKKYFHIYPKVKEYMEEQMRKIDREDYIETILGRKRYINTDIVNQNALHRIAINTPIQGSAADIIKLAMVKIYDKFLSLNLKSYMVLQIHDELIFNVYLEEQEEVLNIVKQNMESSVDLRVPIKVDFKKGKNWLEMEEIHWN